MEHTGGGDRRRLAGPPCSPRPPARPRALPAASREGPRAPEAEASRELTFAPALPRPAWLPPRCHVLSERRRKSRGRPPFPRAAGCRRFWVLDQAARMGMGRGARSPQEALNAHAWAAEGGEEGGGAAGPPRTCSLVRPGL